jgi:hypothetical protein
MARQVEATDTLKFHPGPPCLTLLRPWAGHRRNGLTAVYGVARRQGVQVAAIFYPLGYPSPYAYGSYVPAFGQADHVKK